jgi:diketogulonate reductase-like aldo/keto reductase
MSIPVASPNERGEPSYAVDSTLFHTSETGSPNGRRSQIVHIPALGFGLYMIPNDEKGEQIVQLAIEEAGYRNFDSASVYGNERTVGNGLVKCSSVERSDLFIASKVWNDAQRQGRAGVRKSVEQSLQDLQCAYLDICYVHWPVPGYFVDTYRELQLLLEEGKIRHIGISNCTIEEYQHLVASHGIYIKPLIHQMEVSPFMYRPGLIEFFQNQGILVAASKSLHRATELNQQGSTIQSIADHYGVSCAQVLLRWSLQKGFMPLSKTSKLERMHENRAVYNFALTSGDMDKLDSLTQESSIKSREGRETESKNW